jgi:transcription termination factor Rho
MDRSLLEKKALAELRQIASALELRGFQRMKKADLVDLIIEAGGNGGGAAAPSEDGQRNGERDDRASTGRGDADERGAGDERTERRGDDEPRRGDDAERIRARRRGGPGDERGSERPDRSDGRERDRDERRSGDRDDRRQAVDREERSQGADRDERRQGADRDERRQGGDREERRQGGERDEQRHDDGDRDRGDAADRDRQDDRGERDDQGDDQGRGRNKRDRRRKPRGPGGQQQESYEDAEVREGVLDLLPEGYGFLRVTGYLSGNKDVYVSQSFVRRFGLRRGDRVGGPIRRNKNNDKFPALARVDTLEGEPVDLDQLQRSRRVDFGDLTPLFPNERLKLEVEGKSPMAMRLVDMMAPIGKGQRGLLVSPPKAGKTTVLKQLAHAIEENNPEVHLMVVLVDERPEEVTDFERSTNGEVISSTFDRPADDHTQAAELCIERAKRLVERGRDVVILLDSITRLGRAYNLAAPASGRILSGGIDSAALYPPKRFFGAARNIEEGGSLTIIATALIETGSKMDEVIFEEFKGTGNMELRLDRRMEQKRIFPAIDIQASGTRREELLLSPDELSTIWKLRRLLATMDAEAGLQLLMDKLKATRSNAQFLQMISKSNLQ